MNALIVYFSKFGNTQEVAEAIAQEFRSNGNVDLLNAMELSGVDLEGVDLIVMGTPTHNMNLPKPLRPILEEMPRRSLRGVSVAAFDTSYKMSPFLSKFTASKRLDRKLRKLGGIKLIPPETFHVEGREGPLFPGEIGRAREWAMRIGELANGPNRK